MAGAAMLSRWRLQKADVGRHDESGRGMEEDAVTKAAECHRVGGGGWTTRLEGGAGDSKRRCRYGGRRRWVGSSLAPGATAKDAAMPLSPPTDDGDDETTIELFLRPVKNTIVFYLELA
jgi:hypothetical protein